MHKSLNFLMLIMEQCYSDTAMYSVPFEILNKIISSYCSSIYWEPSGSVVEWLTRDPVVVGLSLTGVIALCP